MHVGDALLAVNVHCGRRLREMVEIDAQVFGGLCRLGFVLLGARAVGLFDLPRLALLHLADFFLLALGQRCYQAVAFGVGCLTTAGLLDRVRRCFCGLVIAEMTGGFFSLETGQGCDLVLLFVLNFFEAFEKDGSGLQVKVAKVVLTRQDGGGFLGENLDSAEFVFRRKRLCRVWRVCRVQIVESLAIVLLDLRGSFVVLVVAGLVSLFDLALVALLHFLQFLAVTVCKNFKKPVAFRVGVHAGEYAASAHQTQEAAGLLGIDRAVDLSTYFRMAEKKTDQRKTRQIVGFSLTPEFATEIKTEAARRNLALQELLREMWALYKAKKPG